MPTEKQLKIWVCYLRDTHPLLEVQWMLVTTCSLSNQSFAQGHGAYGFQPGVLHHGLQRKQDSAEAPWPGSPAALASPHTGAAKSLPASELPQQPGSQGASCSRSSRVAQPVPRCLSSPARLGSQEESRLPLRRARPAMAAAPSRHCAQGSFACHIPDMEPSCDGRAAKQPSA